jgi:hypothetical protein
MKLFLTYWPDGSLSIISARSYEELYWNADLESDPHAAKFLCIKNLHLTSDSNTSPFLVDFDCHVPWMDKDAKWFEITVSFINFTTPLGKEWCWDYIRKADNPKLSFPCFSEN